MPEDPKKTENKSQSERYKTFGFILALCLVCGLILSILATSLEGPQKRAKKLNQITELLKAAEIVGPDGNFQVNKDGQHFPGVFNSESGTVQFKNEIIQANSEDLLQFFDERVRPLLTDESGKVYTFKEANLDYLKYFEANKKTGYAQLKYKLFYEILSSDRKTVTAYVIPINGFGLWDAIYGFIALEPDAIHVIGTTWYDQKETPGLGAEIASSEWQEQFQGKRIFQSAKPQLNLEKDPLGIIVTKGKVKETFSSSDLSESAVDGLSGATLTGEGVTSAYRSSLTPYRAFLMAKNRGYKK